MKLRKLAAMALVILMALTVFGCGSSSGNAGGNSGQGNQGASDH